MAAKYARNERLLLKRVEDNANDAYAWYYLAVQYQQQGWTWLASHAALEALSCTGRLQPEHVQPLQVLVK